MQFIFQICFCFSCTVYLYLDHFKVLHWYVDLSWYLQFLWLSLQYVLRTISLMLKQLVSFYIAVVFESVLEFVSFQPDKYVSSVSCVFNPIARSAVKSPCFSQVQRNQCGENLASSACAQTTEGHQQGQGTKGSHTQTYESAYQNTYMRQSCSVHSQPFLAVFFPACSAVCVCGYQDHRQYRHRDHVTPVYVRLYRSTTLQGKEEGRKRRSKKKALLNVSCRVFLNIEILIYFFIHF